MKMILIDEQFLYIGSANVTGAAMGKRKPNNINFELGIITEEREYILASEKYFLEIFTGRYCENCKRQKDRRPGFYCSGIQTYRKK
ncbi:MAG: phospholipase D-like domain-containing protein [Candidatus Hodarchaeota archaeon]